jgi:hypothetical protein
LADVELWLEEGQARHATTVERVAALEVRVASLTRMVERLRVVR